MHPNVMDKSYIFHAEMTFAGICCCSLYSDLEYPAQGQHFITQMEHSCLRLYLHDVHQFPEILKHCQMSN